MATGRLIVIRESDYAVVGELSSALLAGDGVLAVNTDTSNTVYAATVAGNFVAIDVSDPTAPTVSGSISASALLEDPTAIMYNYGYVYVAGNADDSISRIPISDPTSLAIDATLGYASLTDVTDLTPLSGGYGAAACPTTTSVVVGTIAAVSDELIDATVFTGIIAMDRDTSGLMLYTVATGSQKLACVDVSVRNDILLVGSLSNSNLSAAIDLAAAGDYVYVVTTAGKVIIFNVGDPSAPTLVGTYTNASGLGTPSGIVVSDEGVVYIVDSAGSLVALDFASIDRVNYGEYPIDFDGEYNVDSRIHLEITGPATVLALTYKVDDADNTPPTEQ